MVSPLCSLSCSCGFHVHRTPHFRSFQCTMMKKGGFELKSWCSRVMLHSLHTSVGGSWHENLSFGRVWGQLCDAESQRWGRICVPWGWSTQAAEIDKWRWNPSDPMGKIGPESEMNGGDCLPFERSTSNFAFQVGRWTRWDRMGTNIDKTLYYSLSIFW